MDPKDIEPDVPQDEIDAAAVDEGGEQPEVVEKEKPQTMVPHAALHEERQRRKELQQEVLREREDRARENAVLQDRLAQLFAAQNPPQQYRDPDRDPDPLQAMAHNQALTVQQLQALQQERATEQARQQYAQQEAQLIGWAQAETARFNAEVPDFEDAYKHVRQMRGNELAAMGWAPPQVADILKKDELWVLQNAAQTGQNPAEIVYRMAKATGYAQQKQPAAGKIETLNKGMQASKTLGPGGAKAGIPTPEEIAAMSEDDFAEVMATLSKKGLRISDVM